jgi:hypothetical protein
MKQVHERDRAVDMSGVAGAEAAASRIFAAIQLYPPNRETEAISARPLRSAGGKSRNGSMQFSTC